MIEDFSILESKNDVKESKEITIFPKETVSIWMQKMSNSILENIKYNWLDIINPPFVDIWCVWKGLLCLNYKMIFMIFKRKYR